MDSQLKFACNFCESSAEQLADMEQLEHIRMEHLDSIADSSNSSSYLNVLGDLMMQCSFYNAIGQTQAATKLIKAVKRGTSNAKIDQQAKAPALPFIITFGDDTSNQGVKVPFGKKRVTWTDLVCEFCQKTFSSLNSLRAHEDWKHNQVSSGANKCNNCEQRYHSLYLLHRHQRCHNIEKNGKESGQLKILTGLHEQRGVSPESGLKFKNASWLQKHRDEEHADHVSLPRTNASNNKRAKRKSTVYRCLECNRTIYATVARHLTAFHIKKKEVVGCSECDYRNCGHLGNAMKHIATAHNGKGHVIDQRESIVTEIQQLAKEIIRKTDAAHYQRQKLAHCAECNYWMNIASVRGHLAAKHIGKRCLQCKSCQFSTNWHTKTMKRHIQAHHAGRNVGFVDKRHEIGDEIRKLIKECITFHTKG